MIMYIICGIIIIGIFASIGIIKIIEDITINAEKEVEKNEKTNENK